MMDAKKIMIHPTPRNVAAFDALHEGHRIVQGYRLYAAGAKDRRVRQWASERVVPALEALFRVAEAVKGLPEFVSIFAMAELEALRTRGGWLRESAAYIGGDDYAVQILTEGPDLAVHVWTREAVLDAVGAFEGADLLVRRDREGRLTHTGLGGGAIDAVDPSGFCYGLHTREDGYGRLVVVGRVRVFEGAKNARALVRDRARERKADVSIETPGVWSQNTIHEIPEWYGSIRGEDRYPAVCVVDQGAVPGARIVGPIA